MASSVSTIHHSNLNLSPAQKELLQWHHRLGHMGFKKIQFLMRTGVLANTEATNSLHASTCKLTTPFVQHVSLVNRDKGHLHEKSSVVKDVEDNLKKDKLFRGQCIAVDHCITSTKGRLFTSRAKTKDTDMYIGGALFMDMSSKQVENVFQQHLNTHGTLKAKQHFELKCKDAGVIPFEYISDNGSAFTSKFYAAHLSNFSQIQHFAGVAAHHHNGVAEKAIQTVMFIARTMMLHSLYIGQKSLTPPFGPWQSSMLPISTTRFLILPQASAQMMSSPGHDEGNQSSMTFMFADVHSIFWTRQSLMERNFHVGNKEFLKESSWV